MVKFNKHIGFQEFKEHDTYQGFNYDLFYRTENFNPNAEKHIFVTGCSYTFGWNIVKYENTWGYVLKNLYHLNTGLMNFGKDSQGNDYIVRTILPQCNIFKPDLLVVQFSDIMREEFYRESYLEENETFKGEDLTPLIPSFWKNHSTAPQEAISYFNYYNEYLGIKRYLFHILLIQNYCKSNSISYLMSGFRDFNKSELEKRACAFESLAPLWNLIDSKYLLEFNLTTSLDCCVNDTYHPGIKSHKYFAEKVHEKILELGL